MRTKPKPFVDYEVTVSMEPQTFTVYGRDTDEVKDKAILMIGLAGFKEFCDVSLALLPSTPLDARGSS